MPTTDMYLLWVVFLGCLQHQAYTQRPEIVDEIFPEVKQKGQTGYLNCTVVNKGPGSVVQWTKLQTVNGGSPILLSEDETIVYQGYNHGINEDSGLDKYDVQSRTNGRRITYMLVIRYLAEEDNGGYVCTIKIPGVEWTHWPTKIGQLTVQIAPKILSNMKSLYEVDLGSDLQMNCEARGIPSPNITWTREDGRSLSTGRLQSQGNPLTLTAIQKSDRGYYICEADNGINPPAILRVEVAVYFPPLLTPVESVVGQAQNRRFEAKLECIVAGYPVPAVKWMKEDISGNRIEIQDDDKYDITKDFSILQSDEFWSTLLVKNVQAIDYTKYYCVGHNRYGNGETSITLTETMECQGPNCPSENCMNILGNSSVVTNRPITEMYLLWVVFLGCLQHQVKAQRPAIVNDFVPQIKKVGETAYLSCTVSSQGPYSAVSWLLFAPGDNILIYMTTNTEVFTGDKRHDIQVKQSALGTTYTLIIRPVSEQDAGDYMCRVKIPGVSLSEWLRKRVTLTVQFAPEIKRNMKSLYEVDLESDLQMDCEARGIPSPNITWTREDGRSLSTGRLQSQVKLQYNGTPLTLTAIKKSDRGYYICEADNGIKPPATVRVEVAVFFPPSLTPVESVVGQAQNRRFDAKLECIVAGYPLPAVKWMKEAENGNRIELQDSDKYDITKDVSILQNDEFWSTLLVRNVQANDYTKYYCIGHNGYGNGETSITLTETMECQGPNCPSEELVGM
ncbi:hemicentin-1-like [Saccostrea cucullata]|uniref:hemicentin-1-like n=1 Tax=Saccostrea cuccullata TaxID=36930 RepID=UPI002ED1EEBE